jgi:hypothetical protein
MICSICRTAVWSPATDRLALTDQRAGRAMRPSILRRSFGKNALAYSLLAVPCC